MLKKIMKFAFYLSLFLFVFAIVISWRKAIWINKNEPTFYYMPNAAYIHVVSTAFGGSNDFPQHTRFAPLVSESKYSSCQKDVRRLGTCLGIGRVPSQEMHRLIDENVSSLWIERFAFIGINNPEFSNNPKWRAALVEVVNNPCSFLPTGDELEEFKSTFLSVHDQGSRWEEWKHNMTYNSYGLFRCGDTFPKAKVIIGIYDGVEPKNAAEKNLVELIVIKAKGDSSIPPVYSSH